MSVLKYLGVFILLVGAAVLIVPALMSKVTNEILLAGLGLIIVGFIGHIILFKKKY